MFLTCCEGAAAQSPGPDMKLHPKDTPENWHGPSRACDFSCSSSPLMGLRGHSVGTWAF